MKRFFVIAVLVAMVAASASAQAYKRSRYYNSRSGRLDYAQRHGSSYNNHMTRYGTDMYYGFRVGPTFSTVSSETSLKAGSSKTGLNAGIALGYGLSDYAPLYLETGIYYTQKGGKNKDVSGKQFTYNLDYLEVPLEMKYIYSPDGHLTIEPHFGGYVACGVAGKVKDYGSREAYSSFDSDKPDHFNRVDAGLRFGCGIGYDMFYAEVAYDLGLANVGNDSFNETKNRTLMLNFGINF